MTMILVVIIILDAILVLSALMLSIHAGINLILLLTWDLLASSPPQYHPQYQSHCLHLIVLTISHPILMIPNGFLLVQEGFLQIHSATSPTN